MTEGVGSLAAGALRRPALRRLNFVDAFLWAFRLAVILVVVWGTVGTLRLGRYTGEQWVDFVVFGLAQGGIYALIALGYTMVYGILRMINFAHGEVFMSGAYTAYFAAAPLAASGFLNQHPILSLLLLMAVAAAVSTGVAVLVERVAYRPLRRAPRLVPLITAIGASFFLQYAFRGLYGSGFKAYP
ncbi:MAG: branched-chain amino acid ABC transporter permease, partial [Armatimonadota bacterium]|nr:branched-chain amino acid ABC transporter permease [Armatimonadota bacterium]